MSLKPMKPLIKPTNIIVDDVSNKEIRTIQFDDVKEPKTVEQFRENLKKYYVCIRDELYNNNGRDIDINQLNSMRDLYPNDFNRKWYVDVGAPIIFAMFLNIFFPHILDLATVPISTD